MTTAIVAFTNTCGLHSTAVADICSTSSHDGVFAAINPVTTSCFCAKCMGVDVVKALAEELHHGNRHLRQPDLLQVVR